LFFRDFTPTSTNVLGAENFGQRLAAFELTTCCTLGFALIGSTLFIYHISMLHEISIHVRPSTLASFIQEIAIENLLR